MSIVKKSFDSPDETANPGEKMKFEVVTVGDTKIQRVSVDAGWQWSKHIKPNVGTESCEKNHTIYMISGKLGTRLDDGTEEEFGPGDVVFIPAGHDGWTVGDEPAVWLEVLS